MQDVQEETSEVKDTSEFDDESFEVHDARDFGVYFIDNLVVDQYMPKIGPYGFMVYSLIARIVGHRGCQCYLSINQMVKRLGYSKTYVNKGLKRLEKHGLIRCERQEGPIDSTPALYTVLRVPEASTPLERRVTDAGRESCYKEQI